MANEKPDINRLVWPTHGDKLAWLDRAQTIMDVLTRAGTMWLGYNAFEKMSKGSGLSGAVVSQIAMKLATANNLVAGAVGVATLGMMGLTNIVPPIDTAGHQHVDVHTWAKNLGTSPPIDVHAIDR